MLAVAVVLFVFVLEAVWGPLRQREVWPLLLLLLALAAGAVRPSCPRPFFALSPLFRCLCFFPLLCVGALVKQSLTDSNSTITRTKYSLFNFVCGRFLYGKPKKRSYFRRASHTKRKTAANKLSTGQASAISGTVPANHAHRNMRSL